MDKTALFSIFWILKLRYFRFFGSLNCTILVKKCLNLVDWASGGAVRG